MAWRCFVFPVYMMNQKVLFACFYYRYDENEIVKLNCKNCVKNAVLACFFIYEDRCTVYGYYVLIY